MLEGRQKNLIDIINTTWLQNDEMEEVCDLFDTAPGHDH